MAVDMTPPIPAGRQIIGGYDAQGFTIDDQRHEGPVLVLLDETFAWRDASSLSAQTLGPVINADPKVEFLLVGLGATLRPLPKAFKDALREAGIVAEPMTTGAACRTFNVLLAEGRRVAAALLPDARW